MSSKTADAPVYPFAPSRLSITARIALFHAVSAFAVLAVSVAFLYTVLIQNLGRDNIHFLADKVHTLEGTLLQHADDSRFLDHEVKWEGGVYTFDQHYILYSRILDEIGRPLIETPDMATVVPTTYFPVPMDPKTSPEVDVVRHWRSPEGRSYILMSALARRGEDGPPRVIQVALDNTAEDVLIEAYQRVSVLILSIGTLLSAGIGMVIARRSMRPLHDIARTAEHITASHLHKRIEPERWPSELTSLARALDKMLGRLEDSFARLSRFSSDLAHELRTPVHNLLGQTEVVLSKPRRPDEYCQILESNLEEYNRLARMINGLLFLARAENPRTKIERARLDARKELDGVREFHEALAQDQGISLVCDGQAHVHADPLLFRRAVTNLLSNALRHTPEGGKVTLLVDQPEDRSVLVTITDTGVGIPPEELPRVFDRFHRWGGASLPYSEGAGLGLAIVKSIMDLHGGAVSVVSTLGRGTTFTLRFPAGSPAVG